MHKVTLNMGSEQLFYTKVGRMQVQRT